jgi:uncharacterized protein with HEPN domain
MRRDELYLADMVEAANHIHTFLDGVAESDFLVDELRKSAVLQKLAIIGEAASRISPEVRATAPEIPWSDIVGFRNIAIHAYFNIKWSVVWLTATVDVPTLEPLIVRLLKTIEQQDDGGKAPE